MSIDNIPRHLKHKPIIGVDYKFIDEEAGAGDAEFLSIGKSQWNQDDISAKVFRQSNGIWSRQSEELPLWRVLDLAKFIIAQITGHDSSLSESVVSDKDMPFLKEFLKENMNLYLPRLEEIKSLLNKSNDL